MAHLYSVIPVRRNLFEYVAIAAWWALLLGLQRRVAPAAGVMTGVILTGCWIKAASFGIENIQQLIHAAKRNLQFHQFVILMAVNMSQIILSFMFDFQLLQTVNPSSFSGVAQGAGIGESLFDFFYLSTLNISFFGYSDILPQTIPARLANLTEILLAFVTVIFVLSDFVSLRDSLHRPDPKR